MKDMEDNGISADDCLYLDVWAPAQSLQWSRCCLQSASQCPVLVLFYGGGLLGGGRDYFHAEGRAKAESGTIFACANYRCGVLGFDADSNSNCGLWDQVQALKWVQNDIGAFGGEPHNVTIMGEVDFLCRS